MSEFVERLVTAAKNEWEFFGFSQYNLDGTTADGKKEHHDGAFQRIGEYWQCVGGPYKNLTGKDTGYPWSAAFVSFCMREAGAGNQFSYSAGHATYINASIRAAKNQDAAASFWAHKKNEYRLKPGDLVGYWRGDSAVSIENALSKGWYQSHTDIIVEVENNYAYVIGGNVSHSVTRKQVRTNSNGYLTDTRYKWFVVMENRL